jgi:HEPN domain-containing protein
VITTEEKVQYWVELSDGDLEVAVTMLRSKHYLYVGFMCHQVVEKIFKGYYTKLVKDTPPYSHELPYLAIRAGFYDSLSEDQKMFVDRLNPLNIRTRYPDYKHTLAKLLTQERCVEIIETTKQLQQWVKTQL